MGWEVESSWRMLSISGQEADGEHEGWKMRNVVVCKGALLQRAAFYVLLTVHLDMCV
jgi:hypothetical protein